MRIIGFILRYSRERRRRRMTAIYSRAGFTAEDIQKLIEMGRF